MTDSEIKNRISDARTMLGWLENCGSDERIKQTWAAHAGNSLLEIAAEMKRRIAKGEIA